MIVLAPITLIFTLGLFPWWAFEPLDHPPAWDTTGLNKEQITHKMHQIVHNMVLHLKFSTNFSGLVEVEADATLKEVENEQQASNGKEEGKGSPEESEKRVEESNASPLAMK